MKKMPKIYEVNATEVISGFYYVEAESPAEAAFLIENGFAEYEQYNHGSDLEYHIDELRDDETCEEVYEYDDHKAFEKAYHDGKQFYKAQGQLSLGDAGQLNDAHNFALKYAREETGLGLAELADVGC